MSKNKPGPATIAANKKTSHDYHLEDRFEAGIVLQGWEVKSLRDGKCQLVDSYVLLKSGEAFLLGAHIEPLNSASSHVDADPKRTRKLLLNQREIGRLFGAVQKDGYSCLATKIYWKKHLIKCEIALGKGKKQHDKRATERERDWNRDKQRLVRDTNR